ncbi:unnamed protein product [Vitrella brassicaformis CCMP3155]|uniref:PNPLA domain-containing protein n=3 Tax=Vitrella brassicaformis TaxID=1169539 RepID=A0A0G4EK88_VITBC|nr:unnamed protein product [Vitrella brassicaformis CCMP3155]|eukprot:CEL96975.1 unnamed protein product [Vitrella brassicaformis CCMP3155]
MILLLISTALFLVMKAFCTVWRLVVSGPVVGCDLVLKTAFVERSLPATTNFLRRSRQHHQHQHQHHQHQQAHARHRPLHGAPVPERERERVVVVFPFGGVFWFWQAGYADYLRTHYDLSDCRFVGASAGAISAVLTASEVPLERAVARALEIADDTDLWSRPLGVFFIWGPLIRQWLHEILPPDCDELCRGRVRMRATGLPSLEARMLPREEGNVSKADLIDAAMASVHIPFFLDGRLCCQVGDDFYVDGGLHVRPLYEGESPLIYVSPPSEQKLWNQLGMLNKAGVWRLFEKGYEHAQSQDRDGHLSILHKHSPPTTDSSPPPPQQHTIRQRVVGVEPMMNVTRAAGAKGMLASGGGLSLAREYGGERERGG